MSEKVKPYTRPEHFGIIATGGNSYISTTATPAPDAEGRWPIEPYGYFTFAWMPKRCRNGRLRWLCWVQRHDDGSYTLGDNAS